VGGGKKDDLIRGVLETGREGAATGDFFPLTALQARLLIWGEGGISSKGSTSRKPNAQGDG